MQKYELLEYLLNHIDYFKGVSVADFYVLAGLDSDELGCMNYDNYLVTPLLQQICKYALVDIALNPDEMSDIEDNLSSNDQSELLDDALNISCVCHQYVDLILTEGANHPCLVNVGYLNNGAFLYNQIMETMCELIKVTHNRFQNDLIDFGNIVDDKLMNIADNMWDHLLEIMEDKEITSGIEVLANLSDYVKNTLVMCNFFPLNQESIYYIGDTYIHYVDRVNADSNVDVLIGDCIISLSIIIEKAHKYSEQSSDDDILELIKNLEEGYHLYNSYRYLYLKNQYREAKMLEKSKKL